MESKRLAGKTAVVTAAGSGIGRASAEAFARAGARVFAADIDGEALETLAGCEGHVLDVRDPAAIAAFAKTAGKVDVLFNCAGIGAQGHRARRRARAVERGVRAQRAHRCST